MEAGRRLQQRWLIRRWELRASAMQLERAVGGVGGGKSYHFISWYSISFTELSTFFFSLFTCYLFLPLKFKLH